MPYHRWQPGEVTNPNGRPKGSRNKRSLEAEAIFAQYGFWPFQEKVALAKRLKEKLRRNNFASSDEKIAYIAEYADILKDLIQYALPRLKQVDHFAHIEIIQKLQSLDQYSDNEIEALLIEARDIANGTA
jgi:predicted metal-dependent phosphoesterase TrpH